MSTVQTIRGPIDSSELGRTLSHEHLTAGSAGMERILGMWDDDEAAEASIEALRRLKAAGIDSIIDLTPFDLGRQMRLFERVAEADTSVHVVCATGVYRWVPAYFLGRDPDDIAEYFVREIEDGLEGTGIKPGIIKLAWDLEYRLSEPSLPSDPRRMLEATARAAARAATATGIPISCHTLARDELGTPLLDIFEDEGLDPAAVTIGHSNDSTDMDYLKRIAARGANVGLDRYGGLRGEEECPPRGPRAGAGAGGLRGADEPRPRCVAEHALRRPPPGQPRLLAPRPHLRGPLAPRQRRLRRRHRRDAGALHPPDVRGGGGDGRAGVTTEGQVDAAWPEPRHVWRATPLLGFSSRVDSAVVGTARVVRVPPAAAPKLLSAARGNLAWIPDSIHLPWTHCLLSDASDSNEETIIACMRLMSESRIWPAGSTHVWRHRMFVVEPTFNTYNTGMFGGTLFQVPLTPSDNWKLSDIRRLNDLLDSVLLCTKTRRIGELGRALRQLLIGDAAHEDARALFEYAIGLEALAVSTSAELSFRFASSIAESAGLLGMRRATALHLARRIYAARSAYAHGRG